MIDLIVVLFFFPDESQAVDIEGLAVISCGPDQHLAQGGMGVYYVIILFSIYVNPGTVAFSIISIAAVSCCGKVVAGIEAVRSHLPV